MIHQIHHRERGLLLKDAFIPPKRSALLGRFHSAEAQIPSHRPRVADLESVRAEWVGLAGQIDRVAIQGFALAIEQFQFQTIIRLNRHGRGSPNPNGETRE